LERKEHNKLEKNRFISWGVSFGSLALVAGMMSYLGLSNGDKANNPSSASQNMPFNNQQSQNDANSQSGQLQGDANSNSNSVFGDDNSSQFGSDNSGNFDNSNDSFGQNQDPFSNGSQSSGHHRGFDTTTGGT
jgi:hypothetical protein